MTSKGPAGPFFVAGPGVVPAPDVVVDTNVALDLLVFGDPRASALRDALALGRCRWIACRAMRDELADVLARSGLRRWTIDRDAVMAAFDATVADVGPPVRHGALSCSDPDDQVFLDLALGRRAGMLISRDKALLRLVKPAARHGLVIVQPEGWRAAQGGLSEPG